MKYQTGRSGRVFVVKFDDGENPLEELTELAKKEKINAAVFWIIGGLKKGRFVAGPKNNELPPIPLWREIVGNNEILGIGTIFWFKDEPKVHLHGVFGRQDIVKMGCLREDPQVFLILEAIVMEILDVTVTRQLDEKSNMVLLKI